MTGDMYDWPAPCVNSHLRDANLIVVRFVRPPVPAECLTVLCVALFCSWWHSVEEAERVYRDNEGRNCAQTSHLEMPRRKLNFSVIYCSGSYVELAHCIVQWHTVWCTITHCAQVHIAKQCKDQLSCFPRQR